VGRLLLVGRLALRDLRRRPGEAALLLLAIMTATTTLTLGLVLHQAAGDPYQRTRAATRGPDVVATVIQPDQLPALRRLATAPGVVAHSGPYPVIPAHLTASGRTVDVQALGRDAGSVPVDQPGINQGGWIRPGGAVLEAAFARALGVRVGDTVTVNGRTYEVAGTAVSAAGAPYPGSSCLVAVGCVNGGTDQELAGLPAGVLRNPGTVWLPAADVPGLATGPLAYVLNLGLADPAAAPAFVEAHPGSESWQQILAETTELTRDVQILLLIGAWLLGVLAMASISVLVGGRMADQTRRVGLLKAVGGTPGLVAAVLLAEYVLVALAASAAGLLVGWLTAPLVGGAGAGLLGAAGRPSVTLPVAGAVTAAALAVAVVATLLPALRATRSSTVAALSDPARPPRRTRWLIALSAGLPVPLLLALRVAARRPRRVLLGLVSIAVTVSGCYVGLVLNAFLADRPLQAGVDDARAALLRSVLLVVMLVLLALAAVNAVFITWATVLDNRRTAALARALGATPAQVSTALAAAQVLPAAVAGLVGAFPGGYALFRFINAATGGDPTRVVLPPPWQQLALAAATVLVVTLLTAVPARLGGRHPVTAALAEV
jgi:putative ABC transport system permease protein